MRNTMKFFVSHIVGDNTTILKLFDEDRKEEAHAYGKQAARGYDTGMIYILKAAFTPYGERADNRFWLYDGYQCGK